jgi:hypothetical protein
MNSDPGDILGNDFYIPIHYISNFLLIIMTLTMNRYKIEELVHKLVLIDKKLDHLRGRSAYDRQKRSAKLYMSILALTVLFVCYDSYLRSHGVSVIICVIIHFTHIITLVAKIHFCRAVMMIRNRLSRVEEVLSLTLPVKSSPNKQLPALAAGGTNDTNNVYCLTYNIMQVASA